MEETARVSELRDLGELLAAMHDPGSCPCCCVRWQSRLTAVQRQLAVRTVLVVGLFRFS